MTKMVKVSLSFDEIFEMKRYITCGAAFADRISFNLVVQLSCLHQINREDFDILTEIRNLEGGLPSSTKPATQFKHPPLYPFWHKHFSTARHTFRNIAERWNLSRGSGNKDLQNMLSEVTRVEAKDPSRLPGSIAHKLILEGLMDRSAARRMTGDWIIFAKCGGQNYYLGVSAHEEGQVGTPAIELYESLKNACAFEFPFLFTED